MSTSKSQEERVWPKPIWVCDNCGDWAEVEPGGVCEVCEKGTICVVQVVPVAERDAAREEARSERRGRDGIIDRLTAELDAAREERDEARHNAAELEKIWKPLGERAQQAEREAERLRRALNELVSACKHGLDGERRIVDLQTRGRIDAAVTRAGFALQPPDGTEEEK